MFPAGGNGGAANMGAAYYAARFNPIYENLLKNMGVALYPFFLDGVAADAKLNQADGIHPTADGVDVIVKNILPMVEAFLGHDLRATELKKEQLITLPKGFPVALRCARAACFAELHKSGRK